MPSAVLGLTDYELLNVVPHFGGLLVAEQAQSLLRGSLKQDPVHSRRARAVVPANSLPDPVPHHRTSLRARTTWCAMPTTLARSARALATSLLPLVTSHLPVRAHDCDLQEVVEDSLQSPREPFVSAAMRPRVASGLGRSQSTSRAEARQGRGEVALQVSVECSRQLRN